MTSAGRGGRGDARPGDEPFARGPADEPFVRGTAAAPFSRGLVDTHCHLEMLGDTAGALRQAWAGGLEAVVTIGIDGPSSHTAAELARTHEGVYATVGLHPHDAQRLDDDLLADLEALAAEPRVVAVGECGLDFYRDRAPRDAQRAAFVAQIELARRVGLPLVVHVRDAGDEALELLGQHAAGLTVVLHCFSLPAAVALCAARGYYCSFAGNVTYKNAADLRAAAAEVPEELLLVETDAPFLTPMPFRGKENRPAHVAYTTEAVAAARGWEPAEAIAVTAANARRVFGLPG
jgi:TatD DNase family protein